MAHAVGSADSPMMPTPVGAILVWGRMNKDQCLREMKINIRAIDC